MAIEKKTGLNIHFLSEGLVNNRRKMRGQVRDVKMFLHYNVNNFFLIKKK